MKDRDVLEFRTGGGCLLLFGFPFLLAGLFILGVAFRLVSVEGGQPPFLLLFLFGLVFAAVGFFLMFAREKTVLNRGQGLVMKGRGFLFPWKWKREPLDDFRRVLIRGEIRQAGESSDETYSVVLERVDAGKDFVIEVSGDYIAARQTAERVARVLRFPLCDLSSGREVVREPDRLDEPFGARLKRTGETVTVSEPPPVVRAVIREDENRLFMEIPPPGLSGTAALRLVPPVLFSLFALYFFGGVLELPMPPPVRIAVTGFLGLFLGFPVIFGFRDFLAHARRSERMTLTADRIRIDRRRGFQWKTVEIPLDEVEDLSLASPPRLEGTRLPGGKLRLPDTFLQDGRTSSPSPGDLGRGVVLGEKTVAFLSWLVKIFPGQKIVLLTDKRMERFGEGLSPEELAWLFAKLKRFMADNAGPGSLRAQ